MVRVGFEKVYCLGGYQGEQIWSGVSSMSGFGKFDPVFVARAKDDMV